MNPQELQARIESAINQAINSKQTPPQAVVLMLEIMKHQLIEQMLHPQPTIIPFRKPMPPGLGGQQ